MARDFYKVTDAYDVALMVRLMDTLGKKEFTFTWEDDNGLDRTIIISPEDIVVLTNLEDGRTEKKIYFRDGSYEILHDSKWK